MQKLMFILLLLVSVALSAQENSQVSYVATVNVTQPFLCSAVQSEGSLCLFGVVIEVDRIAITRTVCSAGGNIEFSDTLITYNNGASWPADVPAYYSSDTIWGHTYIVVKNAANIFIFRIPDLALDTLPTVQVFVNHGLWSNADPNRQFSGVLEMNHFYYRSTTDTHIHSLNLDTNTEAENSFNSGMTFLGRNYLLINWTENNTAHYQLISQWGEITIPTVTGAPFGILSDSSEDIGAGVYIGYWQAGFDNSYYGYWEKQFDNINLVALHQSMMIALPYPTCVVPIGGGIRRFLCLEYDMWTGFDFHTYELVNGDYAEYTGFPNLNLPELETYGRRLFRVSERYIVGVYNNNNTARQFICIDLQEQTITTSSFPPTAGVSETVYTVGSGWGNVIYYARAGEIIIYRVSEPQPNQPEELPLPSIRVTVQPNPFRGETNISIKNINGKVSEAKICNQKGQLVRTLSISNLTNGEQSLLWNGEDDSGKQTGQGVYLLRMAGDKGVSVRKLLKL